MKNILYITTRLPYPLIGGDRMHIYNYLKQLKKLGNKITLVSLVNDDDDIEGIKEHTEFYDKLITVKYNKKFCYLKSVKAIFTGRPFISEYYYEPKMQKIINDEVKTGQYDVVLGYIYRTLPYIKNLKNIKKVLHMCDAFSMMYYRRMMVKKSLWEKFKIFIEYVRVKKAERDCFKYTDKQVVIGHEDLKHLSKFGDTKNATVIGLATDTEYYKPIESELSNSMCFVGAMWYIPNWQAAVYFGKEVFPLIKKEFPDAKFKVIGAEPKPELIEIAKSQEGFEVLGRVEDVREHMKDCKVSVCPTQIAGGIQNKILEAMSMGIPVVTTPEGFEGIGADKTILRVAKNPEEYAQKVIEIMKNPKLREDISVKSREYILKNFSWEKIGEQWENVISEVVGE